MYSFDVGLSLDSIYSIELNAGSSCTMRNNIKGANSVYTYHKMCLDNIIDIRIM